MKYLILLLLLLAPISHSEHELHLSIGKVNQDLFGTIEFDMVSSMVGYTYWLDSIGIRGQYGKSTETGNTLVHQNQYTNTIDHLTNITLMARYPIGDWQLRAGVGYTDYKTTWTVNGNYPEWSKGSDSDISYHFEIIRYFDDVGIGIEYADLYRKTKPNVGKENTNTYMFKVTYRF